MTVSPSSPTTLYIFVDESGDLGFSEKASKYFILSALVTRNHIVVGRIIKKVRQRTLKKKLSQVPELKFSRSPENVRKKVLDLLVKQDVEIWYVCLRKDRVYERLKSQHNIIYNYLTGFIVERIPLMPIKSVKIVVDKSLSKINRDKFNEYLKNKHIFITQKIGKLPVSISIDHVDSCADPCLQVVDFVSGAIFRKHEFGDPQFYDIIKPKIKEEMIKW